MYTFSKSFIDRDTDKTKCTIVEVLINFRQFQTKLKIHSIISAAKILIKSEVDGSGLIIKLKVWALLKME